jgi:hypothetical protein
MSETGSLARTGVTRYKIISLWESFVRSLSVLLVRWATGIHYYFRCADEDHGVHVFFLVPEESD